MLKGERLFLIIFVPLLLLICAVGGYFIVDRATGTDRPVNALVISKQHEPGHWSKHEHKTCTTVNKVPFCTSTWHDHWNPPTWQLQLLDGDAAWWVSVSEAEYNAAAPNETHRMVTTRVGGLSGRVYR